MAPDVHNKLKALFNKLNSAGNVELKTANGLFTQIKFPIKKVSGSGFFFINNKNIVIMQQYNSTDDCINSEDRK